MIFMPNCKSSNLQEAVAATGVGQSIAGTGNSGGSASYILCPNSLPWYCGTCVKVDESLVEMKSRHEVISIWYSEGLIWIRDSLQMRGSRRNRSSTYKMKSRWGSLWWSKPSQLESSKIESKFHAFFWKLIGCCTYHLSSPIHFFGLTLEKSVIPQSSPSLRQFMPSWIAKLPNCWRNLVEAEIVAMLSSFQRCEIGTAKGMSENKHR